MQTSVVEAILANREKGAKRLANEYKERLLAVALRLGVDKSEAEALVWRTIDEAVRSINGYKDQSSFFAWLSKILVNCHGKSVRRKSNSTVTFMADPPEPSASEADISVDCRRVFEAVDATFLREAIESLPEEMKEAVIMRYFMEQPIGKVAKVLSLPIGTVKSRLHYARILLGRKLGANAKKPTIVACAVLLLMSAFGIGWLGVAQLGERTSSPVQTEDQSALFAGGDEPATGAVQSVERASSPAQAEDGIPPSAGGGIRSAGEDGESGAPVRGAAVLAAPETEFCPAAAPNVGDYVQDGLVLNYDGICNAGADLPHDANATVWKNVAPGGGWDLVRSDRTAGGSGAAWLEDGFAFSNNTCFSSSEPLVMPAACTYQALVDAKSNRSAKPYDQGASVAYVFVPGTSDGDDWSKGSISLRYSSANGQVAEFSAHYYADGAWAYAARPQFYHPAGDNPFLYLTALKTTESVSVFEGTAAPTSGGRGDGFCRFADLTKATTRRDVVDFETPCFAIGGPGSSQYLTGTFRSFRLYGRALSDAELVWNRMVDEARFFGGPSLCGGAAIVVGSSLPEVCGVETNGSYVVGSSGHVFSAARTFAADGRQFAPSGYLLRTWSDESGWGEAVRHAGETSYAASPETKAWITWLWREVVPGHGVADYVQDGLLLHYDGIRNAGEDMPHDGSAATWKDLSGGGHDLVLERRADTPHCHWLADGYRFGDNGAAFRCSDAENPVDLPATLTMQVVLDCSSAEQSSSFTYVYTNDCYQTSASSPNNRKAGGSTVGYVFFVDKDEWSGDAAWKKGSLSVRRDYAPHPVCFVADALNGTRPKFTQPYNSYTTKDGISQGVAYRYATAVLDGDVAAVFQGAAMPTAGDASAYPAHGYETGASTGAQKISNFLLGGPSGQHFKGVVKSFRLYGRALSDEELAWNRAVDEERFFGVMPATNAVLASAVPSLHGANGNGAYAVGSDGYTFAAPASALDHAGVEYRCSGHTLERWSAGGWGSAETSAELSRTVTQGEKVRLTWLWEPVRGRRSAADYDVQDYVQEGLVLHYDGRRNAGAGQPHCTNSVYWANLAGSGFDLRRMRYGTLDAGMYAYSDGSEAAGRWADDAFVFDGRSYFVARERSVMPSSPRFTVQVRGEFNGQEQTGRGGYGYVFMPCGVYSVGAVAVRAKDPSLGEGDEPCGYLAVDYFGVSWRDRPTVHEATVGSFTAFGDGSRFAATTGGAPEEWVLGTNAAAYAGLHMTLGGLHAGSIVGGAAAQCVAGRLQNLRFYDRVLSAEELELNRVVDEARFDGVLPRVDVVVSEPKYNADAQAESGPYKVEGEWTFTASHAVDEKGKTRRLAGYTLETWNGDLGRWEGKRRMNETEYTHFAGSSPARVRLTWLWLSDPLMMIVR